MGFSKNGVWSLGSRSRSRLAMGLRASGPGPFPEFRAEIAFSLGRVECLIRILWCSHPIVPIYK